MSDNRTARSIIIIISSITGTIIPIVSIISFLLLLFLILESLVRDFVGTSHDQPQLRSNDSNLSY